MSAEASSAKRAKTSSAPFGTLSVFSYRTPIATLFVPNGQDVTLATLRCLFGPRAHNMFSCTVSAEGRFFAFDEGLLETFGAAKAARDLWHCLYIHEASPDTNGSESSGTMAALSSQLANEKIAVLDVSTLARNFMLVRLENAERALKTLQAAITSEPPPQARPPARHQRPPARHQRPPARHQRPPTTARPPTHPPLPTRAQEPPSAEAGGGIGFGLPQAAVQLALLPGDITIASLALDALPKCAHALLQLLFFPPSTTTTTGTTTTAAANGTNGTTGTGTADANPGFLHFFEMGGEVSLMAEQSALDALDDADAETARALTAALEPTASRGWRALRVTCSSGSDAVGILSAVCRPLAAIPLMNVSTLDANFLLVEGKHLERALELLEPHTAVERL